MIFPSGPVPYAGAWSRLGPMRRRRDGAWECRLHPLARLHVFRGVLYCPECWHVASRTYGRMLAPIARPARLLLMHRTRAARIQAAGEEED